MWINSATKSRLDVIDEEGSSGTGGNKSDLIIESIESERETKPQEMFNPVKARQKRAE